MSARRVTGGVLAAALVLLAGACSRRSGALATYPGECQAVRALVVHNDTQRSIEVMSYMGTSVLQSFAVVPPGSQSSPMPVAQLGRLRDLQFRDYETRQRVGGRIWYSYVCETS